MKPIDPAEVSEDVTLFASSVGGGPLERLVARLRREGRNVVLDSLYDPEEWRGAMSTGRLARMLARAGGVVLYPVLVNLRALRGKVGTLVVTTNPASLPVVTVLLRPLHRSRIVVLVYDLYPEALEAAGLLEVGSVASRIGVALNRLWVRRADAVVFIGQSLMEHAVARYGKPTKGVVIETGADTTEFPGGARAQERIVVSYVGNMGAMHDWQTLASSLAELDEELQASSVEVVVAASGAGAACLREKLTGCRAVTFTGPLEDEEWRRLLSRTSISVVTLRNGAEKTCIPSKAFSALAAGCALLVVAPLSSDLSALVERHDCGRAVVPGDVAGLSRALREMVHDRSELERARKAARHAAEACYDVGRLAQEWHALLNDTRGRGVSRLYPPLKRTLDVLVSGGALVAAAPALAVIAGAILIKMGRPVLFVRERPGRDGRLFRLLKFRTMTLSSEEEDPARDGDRLTPLGAFLRRSSLDELPSLINVLRGDMSLVGPRPLLTRYLERYSASQARRHEVTPGLTGLAQVSGRNTLSWEKKLELDVWYVDNRSLRLDLEILARTVLCVLRREGISQDGHATMPEFMGTTARATSASGVRG